MINFLKIDTIILKKLIQTEKIPETIFYKNKK